MSNISGINNSAAPYTEDYMPAESGSVRTAGRPAQCDSPMRSGYDSYGYESRGCEELDPPFSSTNHQRAMAAVMEIMSLIIDIGCDLRGALRNARNMESQIQIQKLMDAADQTRQAATAVLIAGIIEAAVTIAGAGVELGGALHGIRAMDKTVRQVNWEKFGKDGKYRKNICNKLAGESKDVRKDLKTASTSLEDTAFRCNSNVTNADKAAARKRIDEYVQTEDYQAKTSLQRMDQLSMKYRALAQVAQALAGICRSSGEYVSKHLEADGQVLQAEAKESEHDREVWTDLKKEIDELLGCVLNVMKQIYSGDGQTVSTLMR